MYSRVFRAFACGKISRCQFLPIESEVPRKRSRVCGTPQTRSFCNFFLAGDTVQTEFLQNGLTLTQLSSQFALGTDAMLLADFAKDCHGAVCDLCAGCGQVGMLLASLTDASVTCVELQEEAALQIQKNIAQNRIPDRMRAVCGDIRNIRALLPHGSFDAVVCNPPYYPVGSGFSAKDEAIAVARTELCCTLADVCAAAAWLLSDGGSFYLVHKPERLTDLLTSLREHRLEPKQLRLVQHRQDAPFRFVLLRATLSGKAGLRILPPLTLQEPDGTPSAEYRRIYHMEEP